MLFVRTKIFGIRIVYKRSHNLVLHARFSRTRTRNIREKRKNVREIIRTVKTIGNASKMYGTAIFVLLVLSYGVPFVQFILHALYGQIHVFSNSKTKW